MYITIANSVRAFAQRKGLLLLRCSVGVVFMWFGFLKVVNASPAADLVTQTVFWWDSSWFLPALGWWEMAIGACFFNTTWLRIGVLLLAPHMAGTFLPFVVVPDRVFQHYTPWLLNMEGQYIMKNLLIISAAFVIAARVRECEQQVLVAKAAKS